MIASTFAAMAFSTAFTWPSADPLPVVISVTLPSRLASSSAPCFTPRIAEFFVKSGRMTAIRRFALAAPPWPLAAPVRRAASRATRKSRPPPYFRGSRKLTSSADLRHTFTSLLSCSMVAPGFGTTSSLGWAPSPGPGARRSGRPGDIAARPSPEKPRRLFVGRTGSADAIHVPLSARPASHTVNSGRLADAGGSSILGQPISGNATCVITNHIASKTDRGGAVKSQALTRVLARSP